MSKYFCNNCQNSFDFENPMKITELDFQLCDCGFYAYEMISEFEQIKAGA